MMADAENDPVAPPPIPDQPCKPQHGDEGNEGTPGDDGDSSTILIQNVRSCSDDSFTREPLNGPAEATPDQQAHDVITLVRHEPVDVVTQHASETGKQSQSFPSDVDRTEQPKETALTSEAQEANCTSNPDKPTTDDARQSASETSNEDKKSSTSSFHNEVQAAVLRGEAQDTAAQDTEAQDTEAPDTEAQETEAQNTAAPDTEAQDSEAQDTAADVNVERSVSGEGERESEESVHLREVPGRKSDGFAAVVSDTPMEVHNESSGPSVDDPSTRSADVEPKEDPVQLALHEPSMTALSPISEPSPAPMNATENKGLMESVNLQNDGEASIEVSKGTVRQDGLEDSAQVLATQRSSESEAVTDDDMVIEIAEEKMCDDSDECVLISPDVTPSKGCDQGRKSGTKTGEIVHETPEKNTFEKEDQTRQSVSLSNGIVHEEAEETSAEEQDQEKDLCMEVEEVNDEPESQAGAHHTEQSSKPVNGMSDKMAEEGVEPDSPNSALANPETESATECLDGRESEDEEVEIIEVQDSSFSGEKVPHEHTRKESTLPRCSNEDTIELDEECSDVDITTLDDEPVQLGTVERRSEVILSHVDDEEVQILTEDDLPRTSQNQAEIITLSPEPEAAVIEPESPREQDQEATPRQWTVSDINIQVLPPSMIKTEPLDDLSENEQMRSASDIVVKSEPLDRGYGDQIHCSPATTEPRLGQTVGSISVVNSPAMVTHYQCPQCQRTFQSRSGLGKHMRNKRHKGVVQKINSNVLPRSEIQYQCPDCDASFQRKDELREHMVTANHVSAPLQFAGSSETDDVHTNIQRNLTSLQSGGPPYNCKRCAEKFRLRSELRQHLRERHGVQSSSFKAVPLSFTSTFTCGTCDSAFKYDSELQSHLSLNTACRINLPISERTISGQDWNGPPFKCFKCGIIFTYKNNLMNHMEKEHNITNLELKCNYCDTICSTQEVLRQHVEDSHNQLFPCNYCSREFSKRENLWKHMRMKHASRKGTAPTFGGMGQGSLQQAKGQPFKCFQCHLSFLHVSSLKRHIAHDHANSCKYCQLKFVWKNSLKLHIIEKHPGKPMPKDTEIVAVPNGSTDVPDKSTCIYCHQKFAYKCSLKRHMLKRHPGRPFGPRAEIGTVPETSVDNCCSQFPGKSECYPCKYCHQKFAWKGSLKRHLLKRHPGRPLVLRAEITAVPEVPQLPMPGKSVCYPCKYCHLKFAWKHSVKRHMLARHPGKAVVVRTESLIPEALGGNNRHQLPLSIKKEPGVENAKPESAAQKAYQCRQCKQAYSMKKSVIRHMEAKNHSGSPIVVHLSTLSNNSPGVGFHQCAVCASFYFDKAKLKKHITISGHVQPSAASATVSHSSSPAKVKSPEPQTSQLKCQVCRNNFSCVSSLNRHKRQSGHWERPRPETATCDTALGSLKAGQIRTRYCDVCRIVLKSEQQYQRHLLGPLHAKCAAKVRPGTFAHTCPKCDKGFESPVTLRRHQSMLKHYIPANQSANLNQTQSSRNSAVKQPQRVPNTHHTGSAKLQTVQRTAGSGVDRDIQTTGYKCLVCRKIYGDTRKLGKHLLRTKHKIGHLKLQRAKSSAKARSQSQSTTAVSCVKCLVCLRTYSDKTRLSKHLYSTNHRNKHNSLLAPTQRPTQAPDEPTHKCYQCSKVCGSSLQLSKHLYNSGHRAKHNHLKGLIKQFAGTGVDLSKGIQEDQCLQCGRVAGDRPKLRKHLYNTQHKEEHVRLETQLQALAPSQLQLLKTALKDEKPSTPLQAEKTEHVHAEPGHAEPTVIEPEDWAENMCLSCGKCYENKRKLHKHLYSMKHRQQHEWAKEQRKLGETKVAKESPAENGPKCLVCNKAFRDSTALSRHLREDNHKDGHERIHYKQIMKAVTSTPKVHVEKITPEKLLPEKPTAKRAEASTGKELQNGATAVDRAPGSRDTTCLVCGAVASNPKALRRHLSRRSHLRQHDEMANKSSQDHSSRKLVIKKSLFSHNFSTLSCHRCNKTFQNKKIKRMHILKCRRAPTKAPTNVADHTGCDDASVKDATTETGVEGNHQCYLCEKQYPALTSLKKHVFNSHKVLWKPQQGSKSPPKAPPVLQESFECCHCGKEFSVLSNLKRHMFNAHKVLWTSQLSNTPPPSVTPVKSSDECFQCHLCEKQFQKLTPMKQHVFAAHGQFLPPGAAPAMVKAAAPSTSQAFDCDVCGKQFATITRLKQHTFAVHPEHRRSDRTASEVFPPAQGVSETQRQHITENQPLLFLHKLSLGPGSSNHSQEAEEQLRNCEAREAKTLYTQLKKHLKVLAELSLNSTETAEGGSGKKRTGAPQADDENSGPTPQKRPRLEGVSETVKSSEDTAPRIKCSKCDVTFGSMTGLRKHLKNKAHRWQCPYCPKIVSKTYRLQAHKAEHERSGTASSTPAPDRSAAVPQTPGIDEDPSNAAVSQDDLRMDFSDGESDGELPVIPQLDESDEEEPNLTVYKCNHCNEKFSNKKDLMQHKEQRHGGCIYKCTHCTQKFDVEVELLNHMLMHRSSTPKEPLEKSDNDKQGTKGMQSDAAISNDQAEAPELDMSVEEGSPMHNPWSDGEVEKAVAASVEKALQESETTVTAQNTNGPNADNEDTLDCSQCGQTFDTGAQLESHILDAHVSVVPQVYQCEICSTTFNCKRSYVRHMTRGKHKQNNMQHKSSPSQAPSQTQESDVDAVGPDEVARPYKCSVCGSSFMYKASYIRHMKEDKHNPNSPIVEQDIMVEKWFECPECASTFMYERGLMNHIKNGVHTVCKVCRKVCPDSVALRSHMSVHVSPRARAMLGETGAFPNLTDGECQNPSELRPDGTNSDQTLGPPTETSNVGPELVSLSSKPAELLNQSDDSVSPDELLEWIAQAKENTENPVGHMSNQPSFNCNNPGITTVDVHNSRAPSEETQMSCSSLNQVDGAEDTVPKRLVKNAHFKEEHTYQCSVCLKSFKLRMALEQHRKKCGSQAEYNCPVCTDIFVTLKDLNSHIALHLEANAEPGLVA